MGIVPQTKKRACFLLCKQFFLQLCCASLDCFLFDSSCSQMIIKCHIWAPYSVINTTTDKNAKKIVKRTKNLVHRFFFLRNKYLNMSICWRWCNAFESKRVFDSISLLDSSDSPFYVLRQDPQSFLNAYLPQSCQWPDRHAVITFKALRSNFPALSHLHVLCLAWYVRAFFTYIHLTFTASLQSKAQHAGKSSSCLICLWNAAVPQS